MRFFSLSQRQKNAKKMCAQCDCLVDGKCEHPVILHRDGNKAQLTWLIHMSNDGLTCQIFRKDCMRCKYYYEIQTDVDKWDERCHLMDEGENVEFDYRRYCPRFEEVKE